MSVATSETTTVKTSEVIAYIQQEVQKVFAAPPEDFLAALRTGISNILCDRESKPESFGPCSDVVSGIAIQDVQHEVVGRSFQKLGTTSKHRILYVHGGGVVAGGPDSHTPMVSRIADAIGLPVFLIDYPLAPENPYPAPLDYVVKGINWFANNRVNPETGEVEADKAEQLFLIGDSAGASLILSAVMQRESSLNAPVDAIACLCALTDFTASGESMLSNVEKDPLISREVVQLLGSMYSPKEPTSNPEISPLFGNYTGLPPTLLQASVHECLYDDSVAFQKRAEQAGKSVQISTWENMPHVWHSFAPLLPESNEAIAEIADFIKQHQR